MRTLEREFIAPDFVLNSDSDTIHERMMRNLPADISSMEGDFPYDFTKPTAIEVSQLIQFQLVRAIMIAFPEYAWGEWLELHGMQAHVNRKEANKASGYITVSGEAGTLIPLGTIFCVAATDIQAAIEFETTEAAELTEGYADIPVIAVSAGEGSNIPANSITIMLKPLKGITSVTNKEPISGGTEAEEDDAYYERIHEEYEDVHSYVGNDSDYKRWAKEVNGIGDCIVESAWDGPGTVKLILIDSNGSPANKQLLDAVYDHIVSPNDRSKRKLPSGDAKLTVVAAENKGIRYECTGMLLEGITPEGAQELFKTEVFNIYTNANKEGILRYNDVRPLLAKIKGVEDFEDFTVNGSHANVPLAKGEYAYTEDVLFWKKED